ncbi:MAG: hypothetical protein IPO07_23795 [Haliscomenobacter sp.]|nr:hypothetical protein [Haliscomenobacter sp.]MBK9491469.1 hypothetical protein [Haliscomenobacter sp.]
MYPQYDRSLTPLDARRQPVLKGGGTLANQTWEFDGNSSEYEFDDDGYEEFWISSDATVGNSNGRL